MSGFEKPALLNRWLFALLAATVLMLSGCEKGPKFINTDVTGSALEAPFTLKDLSGETRTLESYRGKVVVIFFGYTHCPDVCPITLQQWAQVKQALGEDGDRLQVLFVSVDQSRDTPELLKAYVPQFDPSFNALVGSDEELKPLLKGLRVYSAKVDNGDDPKDYLMDHSSSTYVFDANGNIRLLVRHNSETEALIKDVKTLMSEG